MFSKNVDKQAMSKLQMLQSYLITSLQFTALISLNAKINASASTVLRIRTSQLHSKNSRPLICVT